MRHALWLLALTGCADHQPAPRSPTELELDGDLDVVSYHYRQQPPTAVGGTQTFHLHYAGTIPAIPGPLFDLPYTVVIADDRLRIEDQRDTSITIRGVAPGTSTLRFLYEDGSLIDEVQLSVAEIQKIVLDPEVSESLPRDVFFPNERSVAWAPGDHTFRVGLYQGNERLGDTSMQIALAGAERTGLDELHAPSAPVGTYPISVTAGDWPTTTVDFVVVDHADSVSLITDFEPAPTSLHPGLLTSLCFQARSAGRYIVGLTWAITVTGEIEPQPQDTPNCVAVIPRQTSGSISVSAAAAGQSLAMTFPVVAM